MFTFVNMKERLQKVLIHYRWNNQELSEVLGISKGAISHLLNGRNKPSVDVLASLKKARKEISLDWLITGDGNMIIAEKAIQKPADVIVPSLNKEEILKQLNIIKEVHDAYGREINYRIETINAKFK